MRAGDVRQTLVGYTHGRPRYASPPGGVRGAHSLRMVLEVDTPHGRAQAHLQLVERPRGALVLGHGAGGGVSAPDAATAADVATSEGLTVALVEQPYRVAGRRSPPSAGQLDAAWSAVVQHLRAGELEAAARRRRPVPGRAGGLPHRRRAGRRRGSSVSRSRCNRPVGVRVPPRRAASTSSTR